MLPAEITKAQDERTERARAALKDGAFCIVRKSPQTWLVQNGDKQPYDVLQEEGDRWNCTCPDYQRYRGDVRCKHIEAIRLTVAEQPNTQIQEEVKRNMDDINGNGTICGWTKLYHPGGVQVTLPVTLMGVSPEAAKNMLASVSAYLAAGFTVNLPGLEEGEKRETVTHIVRRRKSEDGGGSTPVMDIYTGGNFRTLSVYLDTEKEEITSEFIALFGPLSGFKVFPSNAPLERGKDSETDREFVVPVADRGVQIVFGTNPKYDEAEAERMKAEGKIYKVPKRIFVRFERGGHNETQALKDLGFEAPKPAAPAAPSTPAPAPVKKYGDGTPLGGNADPQAAAAEAHAFDRFVAANTGKAPASKEALRTWIKANPQQA